jgi:hypothetical protein
MYIVGIAGITNNCCTSEWDGWCAYACHTPKICQWDSWYVCNTHANTLKRFFTYLCISQIKTRLWDCRCMYAYHKPNKSKRQLIHDALYVSKHDNETVDASMHVTHQNTLFRRLISMHTAHKTQQIQSCMSYTRQTNDTVDIYMHFYTRARFQDNVYLLSYHAVITAP